MSDHFFENRRNRTLLMLLASAGFCVYKFNDIFLPYFWDEMAGYMSGVLYMVDNGISILPSAVPPDCSFGHPLLVHAIMATVGSVFGSSVAVMHVTTLVFTFAMAYGTFLLAHLLCRSYAVATIAFVICLAQPIVIAQSTQVLLEMFLTLTFVYAVYFYCREKYAWSVFFCVLGVLTKETGIVMAIAFIVQHCLEFILTRDGKKWARLSAIYSIPVLVFCSFLMIQKQTYGWYLNPVNMGKSNLELASMMQKIWDYALEFTFVNQGRFFMTIVLCGAVVLYLVRGVRTYKWDYDRNIMLIAVFCLGFTLFSSIADALERYFLALIPFAMILFSASIWYFRRLRTSLPFVLLAGCMTANFIYIDNGKKYADADMSYRHLVKTSQMVIEYVNSGAFVGDTVAFMFPMKYAALDSRYGYFRKRNFVPDVSFSKKSEYFIYSSPGNFEDHPPDSLILTPAREFRSGYSRAFVYKKREIKATN